MTAPSGFFIRPQWRRGSEWHETTEQFQINDPSVSIQHLDVSNYHIQYQMQPFQWYPLWNEHTNLSFPNHRVLWPLRISNLRIVLPQRFVGNINFILPDVNVDAAWRSTVVTVKDIETMLLQRNFFFGMHCVHLGVIRKLLSLWLDTENINFHDQFSLKEILKQMNFVNFHCIFSICFVRTASCKIR